jgi:hydrogenase-4 component E
MSVTERFRVYAMLIRFQGLLLFGISFYLLEEINFLNLIFVITETLIFKALIVPMLLYKIIRKTGIARVHKNALPIFYSGALTLIALLISVAIAHSMSDPKIDASFLTISIFTMLTGLLQITTHKRIFSHMIGFLVIENAVFLFSIAAGTEMPALINTGILLDIFISVLILSFFITKANIGSLNTNNENLTELKD